MSRYQLRRIGGPPDGGNANSNLSLIPLDSEVLKFGRNPDQVQVVLHSTFYSNMISREHAEIRRNRNADGTTAYYVIDRSLNGTYVNEHRVRGSTLLHPGDLIKFGHVNGAAIAPGQHAPQPQAEFTYIFEKVPRSTSSLQQQHGVAGAYGNAQNAPGYYPATQTMRPAGIQNHFSPAAAVNHPAYGAQTPGTVQAQRLMTAHGGYPAAAYAANAAAATGNPFANPYAHPFLATHQAYAAAAMYNNRMQAAGFPAAAQFSQWPAQNPIHMTPSGYGGLATAPSSSCAVSSAPLITPKVETTQAASPLEKPGAENEGRNSSMAENLDYALDRLFPISRSSGSPQQLQTNLSLNLPPAPGGNPSLNVGSETGPTTGVIISPGLVSTQEGHKRVMECDSSVPSPPKPTLAPPLGLFTKLRDEDNGSLSQDLRELAANAVEKSRAINDSPDTFLNNAPASPVQTKPEVKPPHSVVNVETVDSPKKDAPPSEFSPPPRPPQPPASDIAAKLREKNDIKLPAAKQKQKKKTAALNPGKEPKRVKDTHRRKSNEVARLLNDLTEGSWMHQVARSGDRPTAKGKTASRKRKSDEKSPKSNKGGRSRSRASVGSEGAQLSPSNSSTSASVSSPEPTETPATAPKEVLATLSPESRDKDKCSPLKKRKGFRSPICPSSPKLPPVLTVAVQEKGSSSGKTPMKRGRPPLLPKRGRGRAKLVVQLAERKSRKNRNKASSKIATNSGVERRLTEKKTAVLPKKAPARRGRGRSRKKIGGLTAAEEKELKIEELRGTYNEQSQDQSDTWKWHDPDSSCDAGSKCKKPQTHDVKWVGCDLCTRWFHVDCIDTVITDEEAPYFCVRCRRKEK